MINGRDFDNSDGCRMWVAINSLQTYACRWEDDRYGHPNNGAFVIGLFATREEAENALFEYLVRQRGFERWFTRIAHEYRSLAARSATNRQELIGGELTRDILKEGLFRGDTQSRTMRSFWEDVRTENFQFDLVEHHAGDPFPFYHWAWNTKDVDASHEFYDFIENAYEGNLYCVDIEECAKRSHQIAFDPLYIQDDYKRKASAT